MANFFPHCYMLKTFSLVFSIYQKNSSSLSILKTQNLSLETWFSILEVFRTEDQVSSWDCHLIFHWYCLLLVSAGISILHVPQNLTVGYLKIACQVKFNLSLILCKILKVVFYPWHYKVVSITSCIIKQSTFDFILISRRSCFRAGKSMHNIY